MGYYNGRGVVTGGGDECHPFQSIAYKDYKGVQCYYFVDQRVVTSNTLKSGVSLETAQKTESTINLSSRILEYWWSSTSGAGGRQEWVLPSCKGTKKDVRYSRIGDSNLFELEENNLHQYIRVNSGGWEG